MAEYEYRTEVVSTSPGDLNYRIGKTTERLGNDRWRVRDIRKVNDREAHIEFYREKEGCFITTACQSVLGSEFRDDGVALETLRSHRDRIRDVDADFDALVREYYTHAPTIVAAIEADPDRDRVYREIYDELVLPTNALLRAHDDRAAVDLYFDGFRNLRAKYGV